MRDPRFDPLPSDPSKFIDRLARDLAWGVLNGKWEDAFYLTGIPQWGKLEFSSHYNASSIREYLLAVWNNQLPNPLLLETAGYLQEIPGAGPGDDTSIYQITRMAVQAAQRSSPGPIFISYRRVESSAFALLLSDRLKARGLSPFLDNQPDNANEGIALQPGGKWESDLRNGIKAREYFIVLVGPTTLSSSVVRQEILWALEFGKRIFPVWHNGFDYKSEMQFPEDLPQSIREVITGTQAIPVLSEDPSQYDTVIEKLVSYFENIR